MKGRRQKIGEALAMFGQGNLFGRGIALLRSMGYISEREDRSYDPLEFCRVHSSQNPGTKAEEFLLNTAKQVAVLLQVTDEDIFYREPLKREMDTAKGQRAHSIVFIAADLTEEPHTRGEYASLTREISKRFRVPVVVTFRQGEKMTIAYARRRPSRLPNRGDQDVLLSVSLLSRVNTRAPHRTDLDILGDLCVPRLLGSIKKAALPYNFDGILGAWSDALSTTKLHKQFYSELYK